jgi:hypothetical protein
MLMAVNFLMLDYLLVTAVFLMILVVAVNFLMLDYLLVTAVLLALAAVALDLVLEFLMWKPEIFRLLI